MFAIYGTSGQMFQGPFEELRKVAPTVRSARVRRVEPREQPTDETPHPSHAAAGLPYLSGQALHAYATAQHPDTGRQPLSRVADVMTHHPIVLPDNATVWQAMQLLAQEGLSQAPVVNAQQRLVGLITHNDFMQTDRLPNPQENALVWRARMALPVTEWMVSPVPSVEPDTDIRRLAVALQETGLSGLPVVAAQGLVIGFVSRSDILKAVTHDPPLDLWAG